MTTNETPAVTQEDRKAAADYWMLSRIGNEETLRSYTSGERDNTFIVKAFARHRIASVEAATLKHVQDLEAVRADNNRLAKNYGEKLAEKDAEIARLDNQMRRNAAATLRIGQAYDEMTAERNQLRAKLDEVKGEIQLALKCLDNVTATDDSSNDLGCAENALNRGLSSLPAEPVQKLHELPVHTSFTLKWEAAPRPPVHPNSAIGTQSFDTAEDAAIFMAKRPSDSRFISLTEIKTFRKEVPLPTSPVQEGV